MELTNINSVYSNIYNVVVTSNIKPIFEGITRKVADVYESSKTMFAVNPSQAITFTGNFLGGITGIAAIYGIFKGWERVFSKPKMASQIEGGLNVIESMGEVAKSTVSVGEGLEKVAVITKSSLGWVSAISLFGAILSAASVINNAKKCYESYKFSQNLENLKNTETTYRVAIDSFKNMEGIKKHIGLSKTELFSRIDNMLEAAETKEEEEAVSEQIYKTLKNRVQTKIRSDALSVLAGTISLIASAIIFATPASPVGLVFGGVATAISIGHYIYNWQKNNEFELILKPIAKEDLTITLNEDLT